MTPGRCTCGPAWVYEPGCGHLRRSTDMCSFCEDAPLRDLLEAHAEGDAPDIEDLEEAWS